MRALLLVLLLGACTDTEATKTPPSCADLGCGSAALCNRQGACTCDGMGCTFSEDAGVNTPASQEQSTTQGDNDGKGQ